jgi:IS4 transposase
LERGDAAIFDRAYNNLNWLQSLDDKGVYFVTRLKKNSNYTVKERRTTKGHKYISSDQIIGLQGFYSKRKYPGKLRRIRSRDPETGKAIVILTNNFSWSPATIARIYKERWQIELFFKCIKQQLKVKSFVGTSKNALLSQLWVALIAYLMLSYLKFKSRFRWSLYTLCAILPTNLFSKRNLWDWLNAPYHARSNSPPDPLQLEFDFS